MRHDNRLSGILHAILHVAESKTPMTSEALAVCMRTNPVVVRRTMAGLREAGIVAASKGRGGGWALARPLTDISLRDIHRALGSPDLLGFGGGKEKSQCLLERAVDAALETERQEAETRLLARMEAVRLSDIANDFMHHKTAHHHHTRGHHAHGL